MSKALLYIFTILVMVFCSASYAAAVGDKDPSKDERILTAVEGNSETTQKDAKQETTEGAKKEEEKPAAENSKKPKNSKAAKKEEKENTKDENDEKEEEQEEKRVELRPTILEANMKRLESIGIYSSIKDGALGKDLWSQSRRSVLEKLIEKLPNLNSPRIEQNLILGLLTTSASPSLILNGSDTPHTIDLTTLRIEKLIALGAYDKAMELYTLIDREPYHPRLAKAGIIAMLFNAEKSLACLEYKTIEDRDFQEEFWNDLKLYCHYVLLDNAESKKSLKDAKNPTLRKIGTKKDHRVVYNRHKFKSYSLLSRAILQAEKRLILSALTKQDIDHIPAQDVLMLLKYTDLSDHNRMLLSIKANAYNLLSVEELSDLYLRIAKETKKTPASWNKLPRLLSDAKSERADKKRWEILKQAFAYKKTLEIYALLPFAELIEDTDATALNLSEIQTVFEVLHTAGKRIDNDWLEVLAKKKPTPKQKNLYAGLYLIALIHDSDDKLSKNQIEALKGFQEDSSIKVIKNSKNIIETLDKLKKHIHNPGKVYEKNIDFAALSAYKMPQMDVWDILKATADEQRIGETIALSTLVLHGTDYDKHYPGLYREVLKSLNAVGFTSVSRDLVIESLLKHLN